MTVSGVVELNSLAISLFFLLPGLHLQAFRSVVRCVTCAFFSPPICVLAEPFDYRDSRPAPTSPKATEATRKRVTSWKPNFAHLACELKLLVCGSKNPRKGGNRSRKGFSKTRE